MYISDLHLGGVQTVQVRAFRVLLSAFVRGRVHLHFQTVAEAEAALRDAGFAQAQRAPRRRRWPPERRATAEAGLVHILEASTR